MKKFIYLFSLLFLLGALTSCERANYGPNAKTPSKKETKNVAHLEKEIETTDSKVVPASQEQTGKETHALISPEEELEVPAKETPTPVVPEAIEETTTSETEPAAQITKDDVRHQTQLALETARKFVKQKEELYHSKIDSKLEEFNKRVEALSLQAKLISEQAKTRVTGELTQLNTRVDRTHQQLMELNATNDQTLDELSKQLDEMLGAIEKSLANNLPSSTNEEQG